MTFVTLLRCIVDCFYKYMPNNAAAPPGDKYLNWLFYPNQVNLMPHAALSA